jgi:hypothetical protein
MYFPPDPFAGETFRERYARHRSYGHGPIISATNAAPMWSVIVSGIIAGALFGWFGL